MEKEENLLPKTPELALQSHYFITEFIPLFCAHMHGGTIYRPGGKQIAEIDSIETLRERYEEFVKNYEPEIITRLQNVIFGADKFEEIESQYGLIKGKEWRESYFKLPAWFDSLSLIVGACLEKDSNAQYDFKKIKYNLDLFASFYSKSIQYEKISDQQAVEATQNKNTLANISHRKAGLAVFVILKNGKLYTGDYKRNQKQHSSLSRCNHILYAGEISFYYDKQVKKIKITRITNYSGHYKPSKDNLKAALQHLEKQGFDISECVVYLCDEKSDALFENIKPKSKSAASNYGMLINRLDETFLRKVKVSAREFIEKTDYTSGNHALLEDLELWELITNLAGDVYSLEDAQVNFKPHHICILYQFLNKNGYATELLTLQDIYDLLHLLMLNHPQFNGLILSALEMPNHPVVFIDKTNGLSLVHDDVVNNKDAQGFFKENILTLGVSPEEIPHRAQNGYLLLLIMLEVERVLHKEGILKEKDGLRQLIKGYKKILENNTGFIISFINGPLAKLESLIKRKIVIKKRRPAIQGRLQPRMEEATVFDDEPALERFMVCMQELIVYLVNCEEFLWRNVGDINNFKPLKPLVLEILKLIGCKPWSCQSSFNTALDRFFDVKDVQILADLQHMNAFMKGFILNNEFTGAVEKIINEVVNKEERDNGARVRIFNSCGEKFFPQRIISLIFDFYKINPNLSEPLFLYNEKYKSWLKNLIEAVREYHVETGSVANAVIMDSLNLRFPKKAPSNDVIEIKRQFEEHELFCAYMYAISEANAGKDKQFSSLNNNSKSACFPHLFSGIFQAIALVNFEDPLTKKSILFNEKFFDEVFEKIMWFAFVYTRRLTDNTPQASAWCLPLNLRNGDLDDLMLYLHAEFSSVLDKYNVDHSETKSHELDQVGEDEKRREIKLKKSEENSVVNSNSVESKAFLIWDVRSDLLNEWKNSFLVELKNAAASLDRYKNDIDEASKKLKIVANNMLFQQCAEKIADLELRLKNDNSQNLLSKFKSHLDDLAEAMNDAVSKEGVYESSRNNGVASLTELKAKLDSYDKLIQLEEKILQMSSDFQKNELFEKILSNIKPLKSSLELFEKRGKWLSYCEKFVGLKELLINLQKNSDGNVFNGLHDKFNALLDEFEVANPEGNFDDILMKFDRINNQVIYFEKLLSIEKSIKKLDPSQTQLIEKLQTSVGAFKEKFKLVDGTIFKEFDKMKQWIDDCGKFLKCEKKLSELCAKEVRSNSLGDWKKQLDILFNGFSNDANFLRKKNNNYDFSYLGDFVNSFELLIIYNNKISELQLMLNSTNADVIQNIKGKQAGLLKKINISGKLNAQEAFDLHSDIKNLGDEINLVFSEHKVSVKKSEELNKRRIALNKQYKELLDKKAAEKEQIQSRINGELINQSRYGVNHFFELIQAKKYLEAYLTFVKIYQAVFYLFGDFTSQIKLVDVASASDVQPIIKKLFAGKVSDENLLNISYFLHLINTLVINNSPFAIAKGDFGFLKEILMSSYALQKYGKTLGEDNLQQKIANIFIVAVYRYRAALDYNSHYNTIDDDIYWKIVSELNDDGLFDLWVSHFQLYAACYPALIKAIESSQKSGHEASENYISLLEKANPYLFNCFIREENKGFIIGHLETLQKKLLRSFPVNDVEVIVKQIALQLNLIKHQSLDRLLFIDNEVEHYKKVDKLGANKQGEYFSLLTHTQLYFPMIKFTDAAIAIFEKQKSLIKTNKKISKDNLTCCSQIDYGIKQVACILRDVLCKESVIDQTKKSALVELIDDHRNEEASDFMIEGDEIIVDAVKKLSFLEDVKKFLIKQDQQLTKNIAMFIYYAKKVNNWHDIVNNRVESLSVDVCLSLFDAIINKVDPLGHHTKARASVRLLLSDVKVLVQFGVPIVFSIIYHLREALKALQNILNQNGFLKEKNGLLMLLNQYSYGDNRESIVSHMGLNNLSKDVANILCDSHSKNHQLIDSLATFINGIVNWSAMQWTNDHQEEIKQYKDVFENIKSFVDLKQQSFFDAQELFMCNFSRFEAALTVLSQYVAEEKTVKRDRTSVQVLLTQNVGWPVTSQNLNSHPEEFKKAKEEEQIEEEQKGDKKEFEESYN